MNFLNEDRLHLLYSDKELLAKKVFVLTLTISYENAHIIQTYTRTRSK